VMNILNKEDYQLIAHGPTLHLYTWKVGALMVEGGRTPPQGRTRFHFA